jgi:hypothetical protein
VSWLDRREGKEGEREEKDDATMIAVTRPTIIRSLLSLRLDVDEGSDG